MDDFPSVVGRGAVWRWWSARCSLELVQCSIVTVQWYNGAVLLGLLPRKAEDAAFLRPAGRAATSPLAGSLSQTLLVALCIAEYKQLRLNARTLLSGGDPDQ